MQDWNFSSGGCAINHDFERRERVDFSNGAMNAFMDEMPVMAGVSVYRVSANGRGSFSMSKTAPSGGGRVILGCMMGGRGSWAMEGACAHDWRDGGHAYSLTPVDRAVSYEVSSDGEWNCVAVRLEEEALDSLGRDCRLPPAAKAALQGRLRDHALSLPITAPLRHLMRELVSPAYAGGMARLYRQSKAMEFVAHQLDLMARENTARQTPSGRELIRVRRARDRLLDDLRNPPALDELAASVDLTPRRLNAGFRAVFGTTVFDYLRDARMDAARRILDDGQDVPLKQLAWTVGYGQATNFATAFRRRYGVSPGRYRRGVSG